MEAFTKHETRRELRKPQNLAAPRENIQGMPGIGSSGPGICLGRALDGPGIRGQLLLWEGKKEFPADSNWEGLGWALLRQKILGIAGSGIAGILGQQRAGFTVARKQSST